VTLGVDRHRLDPVRTQVPPGNTLDYLGPLSSEGGDGGSTAEKWPGQLSGEP
jgi:hypothetical protein